MSLKKIAIVGHGFVGKATEFGFSKNSKLFIVDPKVNTSISDIKDFFLILFLSAYLRL